MTTNRLKNKLAAHKEQVSEAYSNGATLREIGDIHNVSAGTVRNCLIEQGVSLRPKGRRRKNPTKTVAERQLPLGTTVTTESVSTLIN